jgi:hypothetical protein
MMPRRLPTTTPSSVYARRRVAAIATLIVLLLVAFLGARTVLADRGGAPASSPAIRLTVAPSVLQAGAYLVQPGDTLWSIGQRFHGSVDVADYVDRLVAAHGDPSVDIGDIIVLP